MEVVASSSQSAPMGATQSELQPREWKIRLEGPESAAPESSRLAALQAETGLTALTLRVCLMRGLENAEAIREFLNPRLETLKDPFTIRDMALGAERAAQARATGERIRVFGDYDVDGTTGASLLSWVLRDFGFRDFDVRQPDRFKDGYGLNVGAVEEAFAHGVKVLITVDCGITSFDAIRRAKELGIDVIVLDHHQVDAVKGLPEALAIINPQRLDCASGLKQLCGCGLAFYFARALRAKGRELGWWPAGQEPNLKQHLDLVVMATAADLVPLLGDNHILVRHGLEVLKSSRKPGVRALLEAAGLGQRDISPGHLGFVIGPRINASGRMVSADLALTLLTTTDPHQATGLAHELERLNKERAEIQNRIWDEVRLRVEAGLQAGKFKHGIVVADPGWHEGVVGIVASRVTETFRKPAAVIAVREDFGKGSVRSFAGKDVLAGLRASSAHLLGFGGHKHAAGLSVAPENLEAFAQAFDDALGQIEDDAGARPLLVEGRAELEDFDVRTLQEIESLGPFGPGNPEPVFTFRAKLGGHQILKGRHLKLNLTPVGAPKTRSIEAIWFHAAERWDVLNGEFFQVVESEWAGVPELNRFRGRVTPSIRVKDWRKHSEIPS